MSLDFRPVDPEDPTALHYRDGVVLGPNVVHISIDCRQLVGYDVEEGLRMLKHACLAAMMAAQENYARRMKNAKHLAEGFLP